MHDFSTDKIPNIVFNICDYQISPKSVTVMTVTSTTYFQSCSVLACADWLRQLLEPALASALSHDPAAIAAASNALTALATLEGLTPGSLQKMLLEVSLQ